VVPNHFVDQFHGQKRDFASEWIGQPPYRLENIVKLSPAKIDFELSVGRTPEILRIAVAIIISRRVKRQPIPTDD
jgi:hypothetical protein